MITVKHLKLTTDMAECKKCSKIAASHSRYHGRGENFWSMPLVLGPKHCADLLQYGPMVKQHAALHFSSQTLDRSG